MNVQSSHDFKAFTSPSKICRSTCFTHHRLAIRFIACRCDPPSQKIDGRL